MTRLKPAAQKALLYMIRHGSITVQDAIQHLHMTELRSRISELKKAGFAIGDVWEEHKDADGSTGHHKRYFLKEDRNGTNS